MGSLHKKVKKYANKLGPMSFSAAHSLTNTAVKNIVGTEKFRKINPIDGAIDKLQTKTMDDTHPIGAHMEKQQDAIDEAKRAATAAANEPAIPLPDEEEIRRNRRRGTASRGGGRASTILTSGGERERFGP